MALDPLLPVVIGADPTAATMDVRLTYEMFMSMKDAMFPHQFPTREDSRTLTERLFQPLRDFWRDDVICELADLIESDTEHGRVVVSIHVRGLYSLATMVCTCKSCDKTIRQDIALHEYTRLRERWGTEWKMGVVQEFITPFYETIAAEPCYGMREYTILAEWLTRRLAAAGALGMPYAQIVHEAVDARLVPPRDVDKLLRDMGFVEDWVPLANSGIILPGRWSGEWELPILRLPPEHPLHTW